MEDRSTDIKKILIDKLKEKGIEYKIIPRFIKDLGYSFQNDPSITLLAVNDRLHFLGWKDVEMDYHTLQLAKASFERDQRKLVI